MAVEVVTECASPESLKRMILEDLHVPKVLKNKIDGWRQVLTWSPTVLCDILGDVKTKFKLCPRRGTLSYKQRFSEDQVIYETDCVYVEGSFKDLKEWFEHYDDSNPPSKKIRLDNPLMEYSYNEYWLYVDYRYMSQLFSDHPDINEAVDWSVFGFQGRNGYQSTIWVGSPGAHTPCHYDSYGCNLVAQVWGRKKWTLFGPSDSKRMYPTRVPYEESSVFSQVNIHNPDLSQYPWHADVLPYTVVLEPGDVLLVPHHWWHYVECLEPSVSINTWIDLPVDNEERVKEAVVKTMISLFPEVTEKGVVNPNEVILPHKQNMQLLTQTLLASASDPCCRNRTVPISSTILINALTKPNVLNSIVKELQGTIAV